MTFKNQLVIFLVVSVVWTLIEHLHVPGWAVGLIALPITLVGGVALLMLHRRLSRRPLNGTLVPQPTAGSRPRGVS